jgi:putative two-component system response regulator
MAAVPTSHLTLIAPAGAMDELTFLSTQIKLHLADPKKESSSFVDRAVQRVKEIQGENLDVPKIECLRDAAQFFYVIGKPFAGISLTQFAISIAEKASEKLLLRKVLNTLGILCADTGNMPLAIQSYVRSLELARELEDTKGECSTWNNLGLALHYSAQYREAIDCFERAIEIAYSHASLGSMKRVALQNIALSSLHLKDFRLGLKNIQLASEEKTEPTSVNDLVNLALRENLYVLLLLEVDNIEKAKERCEIAKRYASLAKTPRAELVAGITEGLYEVNAGLVDLGLSRLSACLEKARVMRSVLREALIAVVKAYELAGKPEQALIYLRELLDQTRNQHEANVLEHLKLDVEFHQNGYSEKPTKALEQQEALLRGKIAEQELFRSRMETLERLAVTAELRDDSTGEHSYRVGKLSAILAAEYGIKQDVVVMVDLAGRLHDIGKVGIPDAILLKPGKLNDAELQIMRAHTTIGADLLAKSNIPQMQMAEDIARYHHEWWNGNGYPNKLAGTAIPLMARITALADVFDALSHKRPYKDAWSVEDTLQEIASLRGKQFDPELTDRFLSLIPRLQAEHGDLDAYLGQAAKGSSFLQAREKIAETLDKSRNADRNLNLSQTPPTAFGTEPN